MSHVAPSEFVKSLRAFCAIFIQGTENAVEKYSFPNTAKSTIFWKGFHPIEGRGEAGLILRFGCP